MNITINTTLKSKQDLLNKQMQALDKIGEFTPSFGPARVALIEAYFQIAVDSNEIQTEELNKKRQLGAIDDEVYNKKKDSLEKAFKKDIEQRTQQIEAARSFRHPNSQIEYAFTCGDKDYFKFSDFNNMPPLRSTKTLVFFREQQMKCDEEFLELHFKANKEILTNKEKIDIFKLNELNEQLGQRLYLALDFEHLYKIASLIYFDKDEDYEDYDFGYNTRKIQHWKKHDGVAFFLRQPLIELFPYLKDMEQNLSTFSMIGKKINRAHLGNILSVLPQSVKGKLNAKLSSYVEATLRE